jgi:hypothetical protein
MEEYPVKTTTRLLPMLLLGIAFLSTPSVSAQPPAAKPPASEPDDAEQAKAILQRTADFLAKAQRFSFNLQIEYDVLQDSGQMIEFGERRKVIMSRPDKLRVDFERSDGDKGITVFDGKELTVFNASNNVYARIAQPGNLDSAITHLVGDLQMRLPLALMLVTTLPQELARRVTEVDYVEKTTLFDVPCDHIAARTATVDFQVWVAEDKRPLPQRVVITYGQEEGKPQFRAQLSDWNLSPEVPESLFTLTLPPNAEQIPIVAQLTRNPDGEKPPAAAPAPDAEKKEVKP